MRILVLGGTRFLGRAVARLALDAGHDVTCAARGVAGPPVAGARFVTVDRDSPTGLSALDGRQFDAVVDVTSRPSHARRAVAALGARVGRWCYVSTISVYADDATAGQRVETAPVLPAAPPEIDDGGPDHEWYGACKVACEEAVRAGIGSERAFICRAGLIVGPEDPSDRFPYWVARLARGGEVLAPGSPDEPVQFIDVADLAGWLVRAAGAGLAGTFDGIGSAMPRARFLAEVATGVGRPDPELTWADQEFLDRNGVRPWSGERALPLWVPLPAYAGLLTRDVTASYAAGLTTRPVVRTAAATLRWMSEEPAAVRRGGLSAEEEAVLLRGWRAGSVGDRVGGGKPA